MILPIGILGLGVLLFFLVILAFMAIRIVQEYERGVIFRLGRCIGAKGPGLFFLIPFVDTMVRVDLRVVTLDVPAQEVITKDNVTIRINAVVYFAVLNPVDAVIKVANHFVATSQIAQTTLRNVAGKFELDEILAEREKISNDLQKIIDEATDAWGVKVSIVEIKDIELPEEMKRVMARQAEAERDRRAKIIAADGEFQAAQKLHEAARILEQTGSALQLRYLQTLVEIASENNSTTIFPIPIEFLKAFASERRPAT